MKTRFLVALVLAGAGTIAFTTSRALPGGETQTSGAQHLPARSPDPFSWLGPLPAKLSADAIIIETAQDLLQMKAAIIGAKRAMSSANRHLVLIAQVTIEATGTMLLGSEIGAALTALESLGIDLVGLNCATGPAEMGEHLRYLARHARLGLSCMPNAGLPVLGRDGATFPLTPDELADAHDVFTREHPAIDLVVLDVTMPRMSGRDAFRHLVEIDPSVRVLFSTGYAAEDITELDGSVGLLGKPYRPNELLTAVRTALKCSPAA